MFDCSMIDGDRVILKRCETLVSALPPGAREVGEGWLRAGRAGKRRDQWNSGEI